MLRRKNYFIKKEFQVSFASRFVMLLIIEAILVVMVFMFLSLDTVTTGYFDSALRVERTIHFFFVPLFFILLVVVGAISLAGMATFMILSHRIAGPLFRIEEDLKEIKNGNLAKRIQLRKTDQLVELKEGINSLVISLDERIGRIKDSIDTVEQSLSQRDQGKLSDAVNQLKSNIDQFKVSESSAEYK